MALEQHNSFACVEYKLASNDQFYNLFVLLGHEKDIKG